MRSRPLLLGTLFALLAPGAAWAGALSPAQIIDNVLELDVWGMNGVELQGAAVLKDRRGRQRTLMFKSLSLRYKEGLSKSLVRFVAPPELAGARFLQIQNDDRDDDRFLYLPELKRARRVAAGQRSGSFMGTDFNFADLDQRDLREGKAAAGADTKIGNFDCYRVVVVPKRQDSPYSKIELDVRKDNFVFLKMTTYDKAGVHYKTLTVRQIKRISGRWFITKSLMQNVRDQHSTALALSKIRVPETVSPQVFTKQQLEK